jgi:hypothetical protein
MNFKRVGAECDVARIRALAVFQRERSRRLIGVCDSSSLGKLFISLLFTFV